MKGLRALLGGLGVVLCVLFPSRLASETPTFAPTATITSLSGLTATVTASGLYALSASPQGWGFEGTVGALQNLAVSQGTDSAGNWRQISFDHGTARSSSIRLYDNQPAVLFTTQYQQSSPNSDPFPSFSLYPRGLYTFSYTGLWNYRFGSLNSRAPWVFFDGQANTFILSPASNFMTAVGQYGANGELQMPVDASIATLPAGFTTRTLLSVGTGVNSTFDSWGQTLTLLTGKNRSSSDSSALLNQLSYWTDAGAAYYYKFGDPTSYVPQLLAMKPLFSGDATPFGSLELDSWYYPKGSPASWTSNGSGMDTFVADPSIFPQGLGAFQQSLGVPLITHARWIDPSSPLRSQYQMSGNVSIDPKYWQVYANYMVANGIQFFEQDWLANQAATAFNLTDPDAFMDNMAAALEAAGRTIIYCMPLSTHILESSKYSNVVAVRVSNDAFKRARWDELLIDSRIPSALGLWPFADNFQSQNAKDILLSTLSAGPVGSGDAAGAIVAANIRQAVRPDGVIVKPDVPIVPTDATFLALAHGGVAPMIASTYTDHGAGMRAAYVVAYDPTNGAMAPVSFTPDSLGISAPAYVYNYFAKTGVVLPHGVPFTDTVDYSGSYYIVVPFGPSGIAFLGDANKFVPSGKKRIAKLSDDGAVHVQVSFAPGEKEVVLQFYSPAEPVVAATVGTVGRPSASPTSHLYSLPVWADANGAASVDLRVTKNSASFQKR